MSIASLPKRSMSRSSSFTVDDATKGEDPTYDGAETLYSMRTPMTEAYDERDDATENTENNSASVASERSGAPSERSGVASEHTGVEDKSAILAFSFSAASRDTEVDVESKTSISRCTDIESEEEESEEEESEEEETEVEESEEEDFVKETIQKVAQAQGGKPPLPPKRGLSRTLSNSSGFRKMLKKVSVVPFLTRTRSDPTQKEDNDDTLSTAKANLVKDVEVFVDNDGVESVESASLAGIEDGSVATSLKEASSKVSEIEDGSVAASLKEVSSKNSEMEDGSVAASLKEASSRTSQKEDGSVAASVKEASSTASQNEDGCVAASLKETSSKASVAEDGSVAGSLKESSSKVSQKEDGSVAASLKEASSKVSEKDAASIATSVKLSEAEDASIATSAKDASVATSVKDVASNASEVEEGTVASRDISTRASEVEDYTVASTVASRDLSSRASEVEDYTTVGSRDVSTRFSEAEDDTIVSTVASGDASTRAPEDDATMVEDQTVGSAAKTIDSRVSEKEASSGASISKDSTSGAPSSAKAETDDSVLGVVKSASSISRSCISEGSAPQDPWPNPWSDSDIGAPKIELRDAVFTAPKAAADFVAVEATDSKTEHSIRSVTSEQVPKEEIKVAQSLGNDSGIQAAPENMESITDALVNESVEIPAPATVTETEPIVESVNVTKSEAPVTVQKSKAKAKRTSSLPFWKRSKKIRSNSEPKASKFKLSYLCLLAPCTSKKTSVPKVTHQTPAQEPPLVSDTQPPMLSVASKSAEQVEADTVDHMTEEATKRTILEMIEIVESEDSPEHQRSASNIQAMTSSPTDLAETKTELEEETKEELAPLDTAASSSKHLSRSWLSEFPSQEETFTDGGKGGTLSYLSSFGDMSKATDSEPAAAPPNEMRSNLNSYFGAIAGAMQRTLYDAPVRELEKLRDMTCASPTATDSDRQVEADPVAVPSVDKAAYGAATAIKQRHQSKDMSNPFAFAFHELVDVLEIGAGSTTARKKNKFEEEKLEMMASASSTMGEGCVSRGDLVF